MPNIEESEHIKDVFLVKLNQFVDERGRFSELFRKEWFPQRKWDAVQSNCSESVPGVLRGLHYHHHQVDYWYVVEGTIRAGLADVRPNSPTYLAAEIIELSETSGLGLFIPVGVAHGFVALTEAKLLYIVDNYYDGSDEYGIAWNDPQINLNWDVEHPTLADRDSNNPLLREIPDADFPP